MNFTRLRRLISYLFLLYVLAITDFWSTFARIWRRDEPRYILDQRPAQLLDKVRSPLSTLKFVKPVIAAVVKSPNKVRKMIFPQGVPLFADDGEQQRSDNTDEDNDDIDHLFSDAVGPTTSDWAAGPRDETTLPRILVAMRSNNRNEADYALNEMVKIVEKIDHDIHIDVVSTAFESFISLANSKDLTDNKCTNILNHLPFLYSCSTSSEEFFPYGKQMLDFLIQCLKRRDQNRRSAIYATTALLERDTISEADLQDKVIPTLFGLLHTRGVVEEQRNELATALCRIAQIRLDPTWMFDHFIPQFSLLLRDEHVHVKKAAIAILGHLSREFGRKFTEEFVVPHVVALISDVNWSVRKIICEIIVEVSHNCPSTVRSNQLAPKFIHLLRDTSRWVAYQAFQELGPFISTFADSSITGLNINEAGRVVSDGSPPTPERRDFHFDKLPDGVYIPGDGIDGRCMSFSQEDADHVLGEMTNMLDNWDQRAFRSEPSFSGSNRSSATSSVAAKCSSVEDLTSLEFDDPDQSFFVDDEDQDENMDDSTDEQQKPRECEVTYWSASPNIVDISDDLVAFGAASVADSLQQLNISKDLNEFSPDRNSDSVKTFSDMSSDTRSFRSEPDEMDYDPIRDCRGSDEDEEKMDTSDVESTEPVTEDLHQPHHVPRDLVDNFLAMVSPAAQSDQDINRYCAHNFPAVAYTLGRESWPLLKDTYKRLSTEDVRVRMTIASSLHEIARIIGQERTDNDLLPIFNQYKDDSVEIRYNILKNLFDFFQCLSEEKRVDMISVLPEIMPLSANNLSNGWRYRHEFVKQCRKLCSLYGNEEINKTISAIALTMVNDKIAEVRSEAVHLIVEIIRRLADAEMPSSAQQSDENWPDKMDLTSNLLKDVITSFAKTQKWSRRLTFTHICYGLLEQKALSEELFRHYLLAQLFGMTSDKVANVRLSACRVLALLDHDLSPQPIGNETTPTVREILKKLSNDPDIDVSREARLTLKEMVEDKTDVPLRARMIQVKEEAFFSPGNVTSYEVKDMSVDAPPNGSTSVSLKDNYDVVDMEVSSTGDEDAKAAEEESNPSEC